MFFLKQMPFLKILVIFCFGIIIAENYNIAPFEKYYLTTIVLLTITLFSLTIIKNNFLFSITSSILIFILGSYMHIIHNEMNNKHHFSYIKQNDTHPKQNLIGEINSIIKTKNGSKLIVNIKNKTIESETIPVSGNLLIYTNVNYDSSQFQIGDLIQFSGYISPIGEAQNPLAFDPKSYYHFQNIHFQSYLKPNQIKLYSPKKSFDLKRYFYQLNSKIKARIYTLLGNTTNANIIISIMLGDKQSLDREILDTFAATGTRHILTVSGMHVGIVALILNFFFSFIKSKSKLFLLVKFVSILSGIWFYALLTGAGSAIMRASFMISLLIIGINLRKHTNIFNILFGSALILLVIYPFQLFQLSFILSYTAMLSILIFFKPINELFTFKKFKLPDYLWQLISLSIAAQILIFPLSLYYFHNAPILFFLTAIISTPMAFATILFGFLMVIVSNISIFIAEFLADILNFIIEYSLKFIQFIESISFNIGEYIYLETTDILLIFIAIAFITIYIKSRKVTYNIAFITMILLLLTNQFIRINNSNYDNKLVIYSTYNTRLLDIFINGKCYTIDDNNLQKNQLTYSAKNLRLFRMPKQMVKIDSLYKENDYIRRKSNIIQIPSSTIVILNNKKDLVPNNIKNIDILVLEGKIKFNLKALNKKYKINKLVLSKGMNYYLRKYWIDAANKLEIPVWDISEKGAFIKNLNILTDV